ncbi:MAG: ABC transporter permease, partial [Campylobacterota bacterium]|nr:ABC transporter permease [Campylobacterota bacterium]
MKNRINFYLLEFAIDALLRQKSKNFFIVVVFTLLTFLLTSVFFITNSIKYELNTTVDALPQIIVQNMKAGRHYDIDIDNVDDILTIHGVEDAISRVWGYYYFEYGDVYFTLVGIEQFETQYKETLSKIVEKFDFDGNSSMIVGRGVQESIKK